jgi:hypothetical protein
MTDIVVVIRTNLKNPDPAHVNYLLLSSLSEVKKSGLHSYITGWETFFSITPDDADNHRTPITDR